MHNYFLVIADARTGSTALQSDLVELTGQRIVFEPFNSRCHSNPISTYQELSNLYLDKKIPFKHIVLSVDMEINKKILEYYDAKIIYLYRNNRLLQALSYYVSTKTDNWHERPDPNLLLEPLDLQLLKHIFINFEIRDLTLRNYIDKMPESDHIFSVSYEQLYGPDRVKFFSRLCAHTGYHSSFKKKGIMRPPVLPMDYLKIPDIAKIFDEKIFKTDLRDPILKTLRRCMDKSRNLQLGEKIVGSR